MLFLLTSVITDMRVNLELFVLYWSRQAIFEKKYCVETLHILKLDFETL